MRSHSAVRSAVTTITRTITVAAGVFAPVYLGELTRIVPFELAEDVLGQTRTREKRLRALPSRVGLYFVLALGLFPRHGYQGVWAKRTAAGLVRCPGRPARAAVLTRGCASGRTVPCLSTAAGRSESRSRGAQRLYHERWQHEITYLALRHTLLQGRVLRSGDPAGLKQEIWALLAVYQAFRMAITDAIATAPGVDPDRASYQLAVQTAQNLVTGADNIITGNTDLAGDIGRAVLANLNPPRRPRVCARRVKSPLSRWNKHPPGKPRTSPRITRLTIIASDHDPPVRESDTPQPVLDPGHRPLTPRH